MIHVDPASTDFEQLPRRVQANIYAAMGWSIDALAEEFGVTQRTVLCWINLDAYQSDLEKARRYRQTEEGKRKRLARRERYIQTDAYRASRERWNAERRARRAAAKQEIAA